jgi:hypothetical protein
MGKREARVLPMYGFFSSFILSGHSAFFSLHFFSVPASAADATVIPA